MIIMREVENQFRLCNYKTDFIHLLNISHFDYSFNNLFPINLLMYPGTISGTSQDVRGFHRDVYDCSSTAKKSVLCRNEKGSGPRQLP